MQGGSRFSYTAVNFHPEVKIYLNTLSSIYRKYVTST